MKIIIGKIYANWCGHCQSLKPEWNKMKKQIKKSNVQIIEIEENQIHKLNKFKKRFPELQVNGYPTIFKIYPNRHIEYYTGNRIVSDMTKWVVEKNRLRSIKKIFRQNANGKTRKQFFGLF
jgi:thiol-disulfide isomerase/thioredoxin